MDIKEMPCPERNMSTVIDLTSGDGEHVPVDMELTCIAPQDAALLEQNEAPAGPEEQTMAVYLRIRPFSKEELCDNEDQNCVAIENSQTVTLNAPKGSATMKSSEKGVGMALHKFSFSKIFGPEVSQSELFEHTVKTQLHYFLDGKNALIFTYGVTNAGKTYTIQGTLKEPGVLPRVLAAAFLHMQGRQYEDMDLKPHLRSAVKQLDPDQVKQERSAKAAILASVKEECESPRIVPGLEAWPNSTVSSPLTATCSQNGTPTTVEVAKTLSEVVEVVSLCTLVKVWVLVKTRNAEPISDPAEGSGCRFTLWVAFFEIYNELVYDLIQPSLCLKSKKRASLRVCDDGAGNAYVKDLKWVNVQNLAEACRILQLGNKNRSAAATKMNQSSSRSHSIFIMKLLKVDGSTVTWTSEFSLCDLAGSERCNKAKTFGERLKEAGNINNSLLILGKCIAGLRHNQTDRTRSGYIPFRESKLTKLFQAVFCGRGRASMIVNINQCASTYDETLHVMKFSAIAKQVVIQAKPLVSLAPCLVQRNGKPLLRNGMMNRQALLESFLSEDEDEEELLDQEDEADMSMMPQNELLSVIENLRAKLVAERRRNVVQEMEIRKEMGDAMIQQILESEELRSQQIEELKESYQEKMENTFEMYKDAIKEHAYQSAMSNVLDDYVPLDELVAEQEKVEALTRKVSELEKATFKSGGDHVALSVERSSQTEPPAAADATVDDRCKPLCKEKRALERLCEDKQQLILSLEKRLMSLGDTLQMVRDDLLRKSAEAETLQRTVAEQDREVASLKTELAKLSLLASQQPKTKKGLLANIKEAVTSPKCTVKRSHRTTARTPHH